MRDLQQDRKRDFESWRGRYLKERYEAGDLSMFDIPGANRDTVLAFAKAAFEAGRAYERDLKAG